MSETCSEVALRDARGPIDQLLANFGGEDGQKWLKEFNKFLRKENSWGIPDAFNWAKVYSIIAGTDAKLAEHFAKELANLKIENRPGFWAIVVLKCVTPNKVMSALKALMTAKKESVYQYIDDLDKDIVHNDRNPESGSYVIYVKKTVEADENLKNKSANMLKDEGVKGITLLERALLEVAYFMETGEHLDAKNVTLCSGSRCSVGRVPHFDWGVGSRKVYVHWSYVDYRSDNVRARAVQQ